MAIKKKVNSAKKSVSRAKRNAKRQTATFKAAYKRNALSTKKANRSLGSRNSVIGAMTNAISKTHTSGRLGAKAGVAHRKTAAKLNKMKTKGAAKINSMQKKGAAKINSMKTKFGSMKKKGASKIGSMKKSAYKMTASHRAAISRALKGKRR
jgi:hypothetical protein